MKGLAIFLVLILGQCLAQEPCKRLAEIAGEIMEFLRNDYYFGELTRWQMRDNIDEVRDEVKKHIGVDITSASEREEFICRAFRIKSLKEVYDFIKSETSLPDVPYQEVCRDYITGIYYYEQGHVPQLDVDFVKQIYGVAKDLANWLETTGFPDTFPPSISAETNQVLQGIADKIDLDNKNEYLREAIRGMLTMLLPVGPTTEREEDRGVNRPTVEELGDWMRESNNIFTYAGIIKENVEKYWFDVGMLQTSYSILNNVRYNYDKILLYLEGLQNFHKSNALTLDTSDCEEPTTTSYD